MEEFRVKCILTMQQILTMSQLHLQVACLQLSAYQRVLYTCAAGDELVLSGLQALKIFVPAAKISAEAPKQFLDISTIKSVYLQLKCTSSQTFLQTVGLDPHSNLRVARPAP